MPFVLYFVSRKYVASVEPVIAKTDDNINSIYSNEKNLSAIQPQPINFPSPVLQNPDNNDVRMFNPDDNYSISIRRSSIRPSKHSQMEHSIGGVSPTMDKSGIPTIVYSDITSFNNDNGNNSPIIPRSPNAGLRTPGMSQYQRPSPSPSSYTSHTKSSANGLGISDPSTTESNDSKSPIYTNNNNLLAPNSNNSPSSAPGSPRSYLGRTGENGGVQSPTIGRLSTPVPRSPEISQVSSIPNSPARSFHPTSMLASALSFKSSMVVPDIHYPEEDVPTISREELLHQQNRFIAFKPKSWFNPFYLAIVSCAALGLSITFMIIFDLTMLGLGHDVLG